MIHDIYQNLLIARNYRDDAFFCVAPPYLILVPPPALPKWGTDEQRERITIQQSVSVSACLL
jgi:hypothetical protein